MSGAKVIAGHAVRRLRRQNGLSQAAMAEMLDISPSYLNLIERNQRPVSAALLVRLVETFDFDPRALTSDAPGGGAAAMRRRLADPLFADLEIDRTELEEWLAAAPGGAEAFARAFDRLAGAGGDAANTPATPDPTLSVRREIERWRNHFPDLDAAAETLADELRLAAGDLYGALAERLRVRHALSIRVLPIDILPDRLVRLDLHARQLQLSECWRRPHASSRWRCNSPSPRRAARSRRWHAARPLATGSRSGCSDAIWRNISPPPSSCPMPVSCVRARRPAMTCPCCNGGSACRSSSWRTG